MKKLRSSLRPRHTEVEGQGLVEYAVLLLLVGIVVIGILVVLGPQIGSVFSATASGAKARDTGNDMPPWYQPSPQATTPTSGGGGGSGGGASDPTTAAATSPATSTPAVSTAVPSTAVPSTAVPSTPPVSTAPPSTAAPSTAAPTTPPVSTAAPSTAAPTTAATTVAPNPPPAPTNLNANWAGSRVNTGWTASTGAAEYRIYRKRNSGSWTLIGIVAAPTIVFADPNPPNSGTLYYRVTAANAAGESGPSNQDTP